MSDSIHHVMVSIPQDDASLPRVRFVGGLVDGLSMRITPSRVRKYARLSFEAGSAQYERTGELSDDGAIIYQPYEASA